MHKPTNTSYEASCRPTGSQRLPVMLLWLLVVIVFTVSAIRASAIPPGLTSPPGELVPPGIGGAASVNQWCPLLEGEPVVPGITVEFEGKTIGFCCAPCRSDFLSDPDSHRDAVAKVILVAQVGDDVQSAAQDDPAKGNRQDEHPWNLQEIASAVWAGVVHLGGWLGRLHPLVIHFPIALLIAAGFTELLAIRKPRDRMLAGTTTYLLMLGAASAIVAAGLGWLNNTLTAHPASTAYLRSIHQWLGTGTMIVALAAAALAWRSSVRMAREGDKGDGEAAPRLRLARRILILVTAVAVAVTGHFGGMLVFGTKYFLW